MDSPKEEVQCDTCFAIFLLAHFEIPRQKSRVGDHRWLSFHIICDDLQSYPVPVAFKAFSTMLLDKHFILLFYNIDFVIY